MVLTNRHHDRDAWKLHEPSAARSTASATASTRLDGRGPVTPFEFGDELPGGILAHEVGAICPDETALHIPAHGALACADGVVRWAGKDGLTLRAGPPHGRPRADQARARGRLPALLELDFDLLLLAHGEPVAEGKQALARFVGAGR